MSNSDMPCGASLGHDCPFWECCAWGQRDHLDIPVTEVEF